MSILKVLYLTTIEKEMISFCLHLILYALLTLMFLKVVQRQDLISCPFGLTGTNPYHHVCIKGSSKDSELS